MWKGFISVVGPEFDGALVSGEFPVYEIEDDRLDADFLSALLRSRYYRRAFRAITLATATDGEPNPRTSRS